MVRTWWKTLARKWLGTHTAHRPARRPAVRLGIEALEDRQLMSVSPLTTVAQHSVSSGLTGLVRSTYAPLALTGATQLAVKAGQPFSTTIGATGGSGEYKFEVASGSLPPNVSFTDLSISLTPGRISATPKSDLGVRLNGVGRRPPLLAT
jgi:hypothetical protein